MTVAEVLIIGHFVLNLFFAVRVINSKRSTGSSLAWLVILFAFPYVGTISYLVIGEARYSGYRIKRINKLTDFYNQYIDRISFPDNLFNHVSQIEPRFWQIGQLNTALNSLQIQPGNSVKLLTTSDEIIDQFIKDIEQAKHTCLLVFYIVSGEGRIAHLLETLMQAAQRGVQCRLLVDAIGSRPFLKSDWPQRLRAAGVNLTTALPVGMFKLLFVRSDLRNHRKILIIDYEKAYTGSYNLVDPKTFKQDSGVGQWIDAMLQCEGPIVPVLAGIFYADWAVENQANYVHTIKSIQEFIDEHPIDNDLSDQRSQTILQAIPSAPSNKYFIVYDTLVSLIHSAQESVMITTPYFVPDETLLTALTTTARKGVEVTIILPEKSDSWLVGKASHAYYQLLLDAGIKLAMFHGGLLHTKTVVIDDSYALFGTVNMDMRSFYLNMEVSLGIYDKETVSIIKNLQLQYLKDCHPVLLKKWQKRPILQRFIERCVRLASPLL